MPSLLEQEIWSQPDGIVRLLEREISHVRKIIDALPPFDYVLIAARGSSDHAATYAKYVWATLAGYPVALATPSLYTLYKTVPRLNGAFVVGISQSGQSPDILAVLEEARKQGRPTLAITNDGASPLASIADHVIELQVGLEQSVAATKTYTAQLAVIALFAALWSGKEQHITAVKTLPSVLAATLHINIDMAEKMERYRYMDRCVVIGRGYNYATAFELALKLKELTSLMATAYSSADFRHGPIATIRDDMAVILCMPSGATFDDMLDLAGELQQRGAELLVISESQRALSLGKTRLHLPNPVAEWLSPIPMILPGQLMALYLTLAKGLDPDRPYGLHKVTRTL